MAPVLTSSTLVGHHRGELSCEATVLDVRPVEDAYEVVSDRTAFYPQNLRWPDQPADRGVMVTPSGEAEVVTVENRPLPASGLAGSDSNSESDEPSFSCAVHVVRTDAPPAPGDVVRWEVDGTHRAAVSRHHSAVHLMALALNEATAECWTKEPPRRDGLGNPDLDSLAIESSTISPEEGVDVYRFGKSLRKKGFDRALLPAPEELAARMTERVQGWVDAAAPVAVVADTDALEGRRTWRADLPEGRAEIPCGGSHVGSTSEVGTVTITVDLDEMMTIRTRARS